MPLIADLRPARTEVLRRLGAAPQSPEVDSALDGLERELLKAARPRYVYKIFKLGWHTGVPVLAECGLALPGGDIHLHLTGCSHAALLAVTLGIEVEALLRARAAVSLSEGVMLSAVADAAVEAACDYAERELRHSVSGTLPYATARFGPGYGDLPLGIQPDVLRVLDAQRQLGLTCNESLMLLPRKSSTAVIGLAEHPLTPRERPSCDICALRAHCENRKRGQPCGNFTRDAQ